MSVLAWIVFGLIAGAIAKFLRPGPDPGGIIVTIIIGIIGAFVGGFIGTTLGWGTVSEFDFRSMVLAVIGGIVVLWIYSAVRKK